MHQFSVSFNDSETGFFTRFIVAEISYGESVRDILEKLYQVLPPEERTNASIIIRPEVKFQLSPTKIKQLLAQEIGAAEHLGERYHFMVEIIRDIQLTFQRFKNHSIHILASEDYHHFLTSNINPSAAMAVDVFNKKFMQKLIGAIQNAEMDYLVKAGNCKLPQLGKQYYRAPSGRYMKAFLRVGNLQISHSAIDALFFWLLPYLQNCLGIITDTWSISSISQNVSRHLVEYEKMGKPLCPIEMLGDYHEQSEQYGSAAAEIIDRFISRIEPHNGENMGQVLILISATHTGSMVKLINRFLSPRGIPKGKVKFVSIFRLSSVSHVPALRDLSDDEDFLPVDKLLDEQKNSAIEIHRRLYFPITMLDIEKPLKLDIVKQYGIFSKRYADISFARVHRTDSDSTPSNFRHHAVWIDTPKLVSHSAFISKFQKKLLALEPRPAIIFHPDRAAANILADKAFNIFLAENAIVRTLQHNDLRLLPKLSKADKGIQKAINDLDSSAAILILDDSFLTGTRINSYQKNLRDFEFKGVCHYLVAIARPEAEKIWRDQKRAFLSARTTARYRI